MQILQNLQVNLHTKLVLLYQSYLGSKLTYMALQLKLKKKTISEIANPK